MHTYSAGERERGKVPAVHYGHYSSYRDGMGLYRLGRCADYTLWRGRSP